ncbi:MAG: N-acetylglucosaminyltransferase, partial [Acidimicrobiales bacterium]
MTTAYLIQTYHLPAQALRLASTIRAGSPDSVILISHDRDAATGVDPGMGDVADSVLHGPGGRGDFGTVDRYLDCLAWIDREIDGVDWVIN